MTKRKKNVLTIEEKLKIYEIVEQGRTLANVTTSLPRL